MAISLYLSSKPFMICYLEITISSTGNHFVILISALLYTITMVSTAHTLMADLYSNLQTGGFFLTHGRGIYTSFTLSYCILILLHPIVY
ncbi:hypothetical protein EDC94DRAFT_597069 [Helicostylum pulchrum]|nr:hypothetical protein EDC94DRAFT_597069 [Helicostylum pulchrum]